MYSFCTVTVQLQRSQRFGVVGPEIYHRQILYLFDIILVLKTQTLGHQYPPTHQDGLCTGQVRFLSGFCPVATQAMFSPDKSGCRIYVRDRLSGAAQLLSAAQRHEAQRKGQAKRGEKRRIGCTKARKCHSSNHLTAFCRNGWQQKCFQHLLLQKILPGKCEINSHRYHACWLHRPPSPQIQC